MCAVLTWRVMVDEGDQHSMVAVECPGCARVVEVGVGAVARVEVCPECGTPFVVAGADGSTEVVEEEDGARAEALARRESELDGLRMRHVIVQRRAAARSRTYAILGAGVCGMLTVKLVIMAWQEGRAHGWGGWEVGYVGVAIVAVWGVVYFGRRAAYWGRESRAGKMPEPEVEPDFSTLGDGTTKARDLEDVR